MRNNLLSIVVPFYNEEWNILILLNEFQTFASKYNFELIFVDDWSIDNTKNIFNEIKSNYNFLKVISYERNKWYWWAILTWLKESTWDILSWMHSDLQTDTKYIFDAYDKYIALNNDKILIKWNRKQRKLSQAIFSNTMWIICSLVFFKKLFEINAQPKVFHRNLYNLFNNPPTDFSLDLYLLVLAKKNGYTIENIDVNFIDRRYWVSKWNTTFKSRYKTILRTIKYIFKLKSWKK